MIAVNASDRGGDGGSPVIAGPNSVAVIDPERGRVIANVPVGGGPEAVVADAHSVWVANVADGSVSQIDAGRRRVVATIAPNVGAEGLAVGGGSAWVSESGRGRAVRHWTPILARRPSRSRSPPRTAPSNRPRRARRRSEAMPWVASPRLAAVFRIDAAKRRADARVDLGNNPSGVAFGAGAVWVSDSVDNTVMRIVPTAGGSVTDTIALGNGPEAIAATPAAIWVLLGEFIERSAASGRAAPETLRQLREAIMERGAGD